MRILILRLILVFLFSTISESLTLSQTPPPDNSIYYDGGVYSCKISPPSGWVLDIDNVRVDGRSAAAYPRDQRYYDASMIIYIWIYKSDSLEFRKKITLDSLRYLKKDSSLTFKKIDSMKISGGRQAYLLITTDPGGKYKLGAAAYIDAGTEMIVCELNISDRVYFVDAETKLYEMLKKFSASPRKDY
ncbi:exported hypothetical protein [Candidatus Zixiibacteriota bacterium]|nr:exported hypothetical protein [candidate division Zixibacteria bacterium]